MLGAPTYQTPGQLGMGVSRSMGAAGAVQAPFPANNLSAPDAYNRGGMLNGPMEAFSSPAANPSTGRIGPNAQSQPGALPPVAGTAPSTSPGGQLATQSRGAGGYMPGGSPQAQIPQGPSDPTNPGHWDSVTNSFVQTPPPAIAPRGAGESNIDYANRISSSIFGADSQHLQGYQQQLLATIVNDPSGQMLTAISNALPSIQLALPLAGQDLGAAEAQRLIGRNDLQSQAGYGIAGTVSGQADLLTQYQQQMAGSDLQRQLNSLQGQGFNQDIGYYKNMIGLAGQNLANQLQGFDLQDVGANQQYGTAMRGLRSDATARGAYLSQGFIDDKSDTKGTLDQNLQQSQLGREGARISNRQQVAGYQHSIQGAQRSLAQVGINGAQYGLNEQQFQTALQQGMRNLGIDSRQGAQQIQSSLAQNDVQSITNVNQFLTNLIQASGQLDNMGTSGSLGNTL